MHKHKEHLEELVKQRTKEIEERNEELFAINIEQERFNEIFVNREIRIKELKDKIRELETL